MTKNKYCSTCGEIKPIERFSKKKTSKDGFSTKCKDCHNKYCKEVWYIKNKEKHILSQKIYKRKNNLKLKAKYYSINIEELEQAFKEADNKCAICGNTTNLFIDHDHKTGKFRGLLCSTCNSGIGHFKDNTILLENAIKYLLNSKLG